MMFFFILGILTTFYAVVLGSLIAGCLWVCTHLWKDIMLLVREKVEDGGSS